MYFQKTYSYNNTTLWVSMNKLYLGRPYRIHYHTAGVTFSFKKYSLDL